MLPRAQPSRRVHHTLRQPQPPTALEAGGYSIDDPRTRRALNEQQDVRFATVGPVYEVESESGNTYKVDIEAATCTCPDFETASARQWL